MIILVRARIYEITFRGRAGPATRAAFDDCQVTVGTSATTLRAELPDQAALVELVQRIVGLRLEVMLVKLVARREPGGSPARGEILRQALRSSTPRSGRG